MRLTIHESTPIAWWEMCARFASKFDEQYPPPHRDCIYTIKYRPDCSVRVYVTRTRRGGMAARAWSENPQAQKEAAQ